MDSLIKILGVVTFVVIVASAAMALFAFPIKWLWNWLMPTIFALPRIDVYQAWGLGTLSAILFKSSPSSSKG